MTIKDKLALLTVEEAADILNVSRFTAVYDAGVLYPSVLRDVVMRLALQYCR